jgi:hypothetical protein
LSSACSSHCRLYTNLPLPPAIHFSTRSILTPSPQHV